MMKIFGLFLAVLIGVMGAMPDAGVVVGFLGFGLGALASMCVAFLRD